MFVIKKEDSTLIYPFTDDTPDKQQLVFSEHVEVLTDASLPRPD